MLARVGEGHDKGGVESRGKGIRLQHMAPVPRGESLTAIAQMLITELERAFAERRNSEGRSLAELWNEEQPQLSLLPAAPCDVSEPITVEISSRALVRVEGAWYSTPSRWARLRATAFIGVEQIRLVCMGESVIHPRVGFGRRRVVYRHYLPELARKPQAVRQIAPELLSELENPGAVFGNCSPPPMVNLRPRASWPKCLAHSRNMEKSGSGQCSKRHSRSSGPAYSIFHRHRCHLNRSSYRTALRTLSSRPPRPPITTTCC